MPQTAIACLLMRGGTSKGPFFRAQDLPADIGLRDKVRLAALGSPDKRQIDGLLAQLQRKLLVDNPMRLYWRTPE